MSLIPTWPFVAGALVLGLAGGFAAEHVRLGARIDRMTTDVALVESRYQAARADDERVARAREKDLLAQAAFALEEKQNEIVRIDARHAAAVDRLQQRPARPAAGPGGVPSATPACKGATGLELSREDGQFLVREAAAAAAQQAALAQCYKAYDALTPTSTR